MKKVYKFILVLVLTLKINQMAQKPITKKKLIDILNWVITIATAAVTFIGNLPLFHNVNP